jgi:Tfp pilus assembly protein FimT
MEMLLVLAVLVMVAALSAPAMTGIMRRATLTKAADDVRTDFTRAHVKAMKTGRIQVFRYELGGRRYRVQPWIAGDDSLETNSQSGASEGLSMEIKTQGNTQGRSTADTGEEKELPEGTTFAAGDATAESRGAVVGEAVANDSSAEGEWSSPILFYPDGSSSDAFVVVGDQFDRGMRIDLTGLTGTAKVGQIATLTTLLDETK